MPAGTFCCRRRLPAQQLYPHLKDWLCHPHPRNSTIRCMATSRITSTASCRRRVTGKLPTCWRVPRRRGKCWKSCERRASGWRERTGTCRSRPGGRRPGKFCPAPAGVLRRRYRRPGLSGQPEGPPGGRPGGCPGDGMFVRRSGRLGPRQVCSCWLGAVCGGGFSARRCRMNWHSQRCLKLQSRQLPNRQRHRSRQRPGRMTRPGRYCPVKCLVKRHRLALRHGKKTRPRRRWKQRSQRTNQNNRNPQPPQLR